MKKSTILAAAIASLVAGQAAADATIYGAAHASIQMTDTKAGLDYSNVKKVVENLAANPLLDPGTAYDVDDNWQVVTNTSKIGFKGSEDLGNGLKAVWKMEMSYDLTDGEGIGSARNSYVGLAGDFGTAVIGRHDTPDKMAFYAAGNDHIGDSLVDINGTFGFQENRVDDAIAYISPAMGDLTFAAAIIPGEKTGAKGDGLADGVSVGVMYNGGPIKAGFGYHDKADVTGYNDDTLMNLGASYNVDNFTVGVQYQMGETGLAGIKLEETIVAVVAAYKMDSNTFVASFGNNELKATIGGLSGKDDSDVFNIGMNHAMSKSTAVWVGFTDTDKGSLQEGSKFAVGMNHKF